MTIGDLARAADVPVSTLRFYERRGLLRPAARSQAGYRLYVAEDVTRVRFLRRAQELGFRLRELAELLEPLRDGQMPRQDIERWGRDKLAELEARMADLRRVHDALQRLLESPCPDPNEPCPILSSLGRPPERPNQYGRGNPG
jgi:DNA-binding transcriptional MerR regulator